MRWEDERYVRFYTRNTPEWLALSWRARGLFGLLMRAVDRAGILAVGKLGPKGVATAIGAPWVEVESPLAELLADGCVQHNGPAVVIPNFLPAQEAPQSDAARKRAQRERARAEVTKRDHMESQIVTGPPVNVTSGHVGSRAVTPSLAVPSLAVDLKSLVEVPSTGEAGQVFAEWVSVHGKGKAAKFTPKRKRLVLARLKEYPLERLFAAIRGCKRSPHHQGQNQTATKYDDLALICRDGEHVEMFEGFNPKVAVLPPPPTKEEEEARWKSTMAEAEREMQSSKLRPRSISSGGE